MTGLEYFRVFIRTYETETWTVMKKEEQAVLIFGKYLEEYKVLNMKMGNGKVGRIEN
jgi:hypothetical protein